MRRGFGIRTSHWRRLVSGTAAPRWCRRSPSPSRTQRSLPSKVKQINPAIIICSMLGCFIPSRMTRTGNVRARRVNLPAFETARLFQRNLWSRVTPWEGFWALHLSFTGSFAARITRGRAAELVPPPRESNLRLPARKDSRIQPKVSKLNLLGNLVPVTVRVSRLLS